MRQITVVETRTNHRTVIEAEVNTVGELLAVLDQNNIGYTGMSIFEGISNAEYSVNRPEAILPHDTPWHDSTTNNLVILLTPEKKNIASGISRTEVFQLLKDKGLADAAIAHFGRHYTNVPTDDLLSFIEENDEEEPENDRPACEAADRCEGCIINAILALTAFLAMHGAIDINCVAKGVDDIAKSIEEYKGKAGDENDNKLPSDISEDDIANMLERMNG